MVGSIGWVATVVFASSYFAKSPARLRAIQGGAAILWVIYGVLIGAMPVIVANAMVTLAALYSWFASSRKQREQEEANAAATEV
jgi:hypothetical protein